MTQQLPSKPTMSDAERKAAEEKFLNGETVKSSFKKTVSKEPKEKLIQTKIKTYVLKLPENIYCDAVICSTKLGCSLKEYYANAINFFNEHNKKER